MKSAILNLRFFIVIGIQLFVLSTQKAYCLDYFWVGNGGNWSDFASHWATSSGGGTFHTQVPTLNDDVYFDANSFSIAGQSVTIDQTIIYCRDMNWTGAINSPSFIGVATNNLKVYGSLFFIPGMTLGYTGYTYFEATAPGKTITMGGKSFNAYIYFQGLGGGWAFQDPFFSSTWIHLVNGTVTTNNQPVNCGAIYSSSSNPRTLNLGSSVVTITGSTWAWWVSSTNLTLNAGTSLIRLTSNGSPDIRDANSLTFYDVIFTDPGTTAEIISSNNSSFNTVTFNGHGRIAGGHSYSTLNFSAGKTYALQNGNTQTVTNLNSIGTCIDYIDLRSTSAGSQANLSKAAGSLTIDFTQLKDINATGGATFTANNAVDQGNNTGWTINTSPARNLYWIGGSGNWTDPNHWATTSGGAGPACPPTFQDDVFFDANSFSAAGQTVTINSVANCNNMDWTGATNTPTMAGASNLSIFGSLTFIPGMNMTFTGYTYFEATAPGKTITMGGKSFNAYIYFQGVGGGWTFQDPFFSSTWIHLVNGTVTTNNQPVNCGAIYSSSSNPRTLNLGSSIVTISGSTWAWWVSSTNFTLNAGTSLIRLTSNGSPDIRDANSLTFYDVVFTDAVTTAEIISSNNSSFNTVTFNGHGRIAGGHSYSTLNFSAGKTYALQNGNTQTVSTLNSIGTCIDFIDIRSTTAGSQATLSKAAGSLTIDFTQLKDINATGGAAFTANNAVDQGNNTGWTINTSAARNLYWIGGSGNWTDPNHWATISGGAGPACPPTFQDDVFFDANSFSGAGQTVTINSVANCNNMDWIGATNTPTMAGASNLSIFGSLTFIPGMNLTFTGYTYFEATAPGKTITMGGKSFNAYIYFQGVGGGWAFQDPFFSSTWIHLVNGTVTTNNQPVNCGAIYSSSSNPRTLNLGSSVVTITGSTWAWWVSSTNFTLNAGTSLIRLTSNGSPDIRDANNLTFYDVVFTDPGTTAEIISSDNSTFNTVTFFGHGKIAGGHTYDTLTFSAGKTYTLQAGKTQTILGYLVAIGTGGFPIEIESTIPGSPSFFSKASGQVCCEYLFIEDNTAMGGATFVAENSADGGGNSGWIWGSCGPLPIYLLEFTALQSGSSVQLAWTAINESIQDLFTIERSANGSDFNDLSSLSPNEASVYPQKYMAMDVKPLTGQSYYRLKQTDANGQESFSQVRTVTFDEKNADHLFIYPNPARDIIQINILEADQNDLRIVSPLGKDLTSRAIIKSKGSSGISIDISGFPSGLYIVKNGNLTGKVYKQ